MIRRRRDRRQGFTLIELLVVISIIGILVGLLLPAVQSAREAGRRAQCQSNMKNVVLAVQGYITTKNVYPPAGVFGEDTAGVLATDKTTGQPLVSESPANSVIPTNWMPGQSGSTGTPMYSWVVPILPYLDSQELYDQWSMYGNATAGPATVPFYDTGSTFGQLTAGQASNNVIGNTSIGVLKCPDDVTTQTNQGNLSYVVNGGFSLYHAIPYGWAGNVSDGGAGITGLLTWSSGSTFQATIGVTQKLGVMFLQSALPQGNQARIPWNINSTTSSISDGTSNTILLSENVLAGVSTGTAYSSNLAQTNWATPLPTFCMFIGATNVCSSSGAVVAGTAYDCTGKGTGSLLGVITGTTSQQDGPGWAFANRVGTLANVNGGGSLTTEGGYPFSNSSHPGGCNMGFCDGGVRFISNTVDGTVYSKMITSAGSKLPFYVKQLPLNQDSFTN